MSGISKALSSIRTVYDYISIKWWSVGDGGPMDPRLLVHREGQPQYLKWINKFYEGRRKQTVDNSPGTPLYDRQLRGYAMYMVKGVEIGAGEKQTVQLPLEGDSPPRFVLPQGVVPRLLEVRVSDAGVSGVGRESRPLEVDEYRQEGTDPESGGAIVAVHSEDPAISEAKSVAVRYWTDVVFFDPLDKDGSTLDESELETFLVSAFRDSKDYLDDAMQAARSLDNYHADRVSNLEKKYASAYEKR